MDIMKIFQCVDAVEIHSGCLTFVPGGTKDRIKRRRPYLCTARYPVRLMETIYLAPGETRPVRLLLDIPAKLAPEASLLITPVPISSNGHVVTTLAMMDQFRHAGDDEVHTLTTPISNPTDRFIKCAKGIAVARAVVQENRRIAPLHPNPRVEPARTYRRKGKFKAPARRVSTPLARFNHNDRRLWFDRELTNLVDTLMSHSEFTVPVRFTQPTSTSAPASGEPEAPPSHLFERDGHMDVDLGLAGQEREQL